MNEKIAGILYLTAGIVAFIGWYVSAVLMAGMASLFGYSILLTIFGE